MKYDDQNIFAKILRGETPCHRLYEDEETLAFLNIMPESRGHSLVIPKFPATDIFGLDDGHLASLMKTTRRVALVLRTVFAPDGMQLYQLNGEAAGQSIFHIHVHLVPRYKGVTPRGHEEGIEAKEVLREQAEKIRAALNSV